MRSSGPAIGAWDRVEKQPEWGRRTDDQFRGRPQNKVLVALSDVHNCADVANALAAEGVIPTVAFSTAHVSNCLVSEPYSAVAVDEDLVDDVVTQLLAGRPIVPAVVMVGARDRLLDRPSGLLVDDTVTDVAAVAEIAERVLSLLRLARVPLLPSVVRWGPLQLDVRRRSARWNDASLRLTALQFRIMEVLLLAAGSVVSHRDLARRVWGTQSFEDAERIVAHIRRIRKLIEENAAEPRFLLAVRGEGYRLSDQAIVEGTLTVSEVLD